jgi:hypothetical protein
MALAQAMKSEANLSMSRNAACPVGDSDLDRLAALMLSLPVAEVAA